MINTLLSFISDSSLELRAGKITYSLPARRLYMIAPYEELTGTVVYAVPSDIFTQAGLGVASGRNYAIGDDVIFVNAKDSNGSSGLRYGIILGVAPVGTPFSDVSKTSDVIKQIFELQDDASEPEDFCESLSEEVAKVFQLMPMLGDNGFKTRKGLKQQPGSYSISGADTNVSIDDVLIKLASGQSSVTLNSVYDMLDVVSPLFRRVSAGSFEQLYLINDNFFHLAMKGLDVAACYSKEDNNFRSADIFSNYVYGKKSLLLSAEGDEVSSVDQTLDGKVNITGINGVKLTKSIKIRKHLVPKDYPVRYSDKAEIGSPEDLEDITKNTDLWNTVYGADTSVDLAPMPKEGEGLTKVQDVDAISDGLSEDHIEYAKAEATIETLPSGGILLRDAWGSEIRMEGGNIQFSAANNLTLLAGRDTLVIGNGVTTINAGEAIQLGAVNKSVDIKSAKGITLFSENSDVRISGDLISLDSNKINADTGAVRLKATNTLIGGGQVVLNGQEVVVKGSVVSLAGDSSVLQLSNAISIGGQYVGISGNVGIRNSGLKIGGIPDVDGGSSDVRTVAGGCSLTVDGSIATTKSISATQHIATADSVYGKSAAFKHPDIGKLKAAPDSVDLSTTATPDYVISKLPDFVVEFINHAKKLKDKAVFTLKSKAYCIWQPLFAKNTGKSRISIATDNNKNYIYPGKSFWENDGMIVTQKTQEQEGRGMPENYDPEDTYERVGAMTLLLNKSNVEEEVTDE